MKPDQHKKKRSAQYKRKHGMAQKKDVTSTSSKATVPSSNSSGFCASKTPSPATVAKPSAECVSSPQSHSLNKHFTQEEPEEVRSFSRRKIESNWNRYEPLDEDEDDISHDGLKGADFRTLLDQTGDASSQFRFKDEHLWEDDQTDTDKQLQGLEGFPAIDCHDLSQRLMAIPLPVRLNIDHSFFEASMLKSMDEIALRHKEKLDQAPTNKIWISGSYNEIPLLVSSQVLNANTDNESMEDTGFSDRKDEKITSESIQDISQHPLDAVEDNDTIPDMEDEKTREDNTKLYEDFSQDPVDSSIGHSEDNSKHAALFESRRHSTSSQRDELTQATEDTVRENEIICSLSKSGCLDDVDDVAESDRTQTDIGHVAEGDGKIHQVQSETTVDISTEQQNNQTSVYTRTKHQADTELPVGSSSEQTNHAKTHFYSEPKTVETEDDELDFLLSLENPVQTRSNLVNSGRHEEKEEGGNEGQRSPLSLHQDSDVPAKSTPNPVKSPDSTPNGSDSLEDWLDSVLGD